MSSRGDFRQLIEVHTYILTCLRLTGHPNPKGKQNCRNFLLFQLSIPLTVPRKLVFFSCSTEMSFNSIVFVSRATSVLHNNRQAIITTVSVLISVASMSGWLPPSDVMPTSGIICETVAIFTHFRPNTSELLLNKHRNDNFCCREQPARTCAACNLSNVLSPSSSTSSRVFWSALTTVHIREALPVDHKSEGARMSCTHRAFEGPNIDKIMVRQEVSIFRLQLWSWVGKITHRTLTAGDNLLSIALGSVRVCSVVVAPSGLLPSNYVTAVGRFFSLPTFLQTGSIWKKHGKEMRLIYVMVRRIRFELFASEDMITTLAAW